ncbi:hypothetical protein IWQ60_008759 [Tieghemiomyces parasiticus]|uniref:Malonyl-CoA decarboxylase n=1 Tax=Tieghemiomyces parasiticus TaxID=78921 RepID=A0A9W8DMD4_9FUNG|nr:hypothetical protein IWQ60_008759 [Tieghemiomyces parasiticus]
MGLPGHATGTAGSHSARNNSGGGPPHGTATSSPAQADGRSPPTHPALQSFLAFIESQQELANHPSSPSAPAFDAKRHWKRIANYQVEPAFFSYNRLSEPIALHDPVVIREILSKTMTSPTAQGDLVTAAITKSCCELYETLDRTGQSAFIRVLAHDYGVSSAATRTALRAYTTDVAEPATADPPSLPVDPRTRLDREHALRHALTPAYDVFFHRASKVPGGFKFIIDLRSLLLKLVAQAQVPHQEPGYHLVALNRYLRRRLQDWLVGELDLQRITWNSPAATLEKLSNYEAVHAVSGWDDLKKRVGPGRRCYGFFHHTIPYEPLVFVQVALVNRISSNVQKILNDPRPQIAPEDAKCAIFYSITSQRGLAGVELGNFLIKRVVRELQQTHPNLGVFCTLSPIPGFRAWLMRQFGNGSVQVDADSVPAAIDMDHRPELEDYASALADPQLITPTDRARLAALRRDHTGASAADPTAWLTVLRDLVTTAAWAGDQASRDALHPVLMRLCAHYLTHQKRGGLWALDPVANFHLRNGAVVHRINWLADTSPKGLYESLGMMVNYNYVLPDVERNNYNYTRHGAISVTPDDPWLAEAKPQL